MSVGSGDLRKDRLAHAHVFVTCGVCSSKEPLLTADDHHITPRAQGGTDGQANRIWLCPSCHKRLHRVAGLVVKGKLGEAVALTNQVFPTDGGKRGKLWEYAQYAAKAEVEAKEAFEAHRTHVRTLIDVSISDWERVKQVAKSRKTPAKNLAASIIAEWVRANT